MRILQFCPNDIGIQFFQNTVEKFHGIFSSELDDKLYKSFIDESQFISELSERIEEFDVVIITAHGYNSGIVKTNPNSHIPPYKPYIPIISIEDGKHFKSNFIFAYSCLTLNQFGSNCVYNDNAISYIGFRDTIEDVLIIEESKDDFKKSLRKIVESIYVNSFVETFVNFVKKCQTAAEFKDYFILSIERRINELLKLDIINLNSLYNLNLNDNSKELVNNLYLELIAKFDFFAENIDIEGEKNYIPWYFIENQTMESLEKISEKIKLISDKNKDYRNFVMEKATGKLDIYRKVSGIN